MAPRDIALSADGDWDVSAGDLKMVSGSAAVLQSVVIRLQFFAGEWFLDQTAGVPWFRDVLVKNPNVGQIHNVLRDVIVSTPGVTSLTDLSLSFDRTARKLYVSFKAQTDAGSIASTVVV